MTNSKKNLLTRERCIADFQKNRKLDLYFNLLGFIGMFLLFGAFIALLLASTLPSDPGRWIGLVIFSFPQVCMLLRTIAVLRDISRMRKGEFSISVDKVKGIGKGERRYERGIRGEIEAIKDYRFTMSQYADYLHFWEYDRFSPSRTVFDMASVDDEFYVVVLNNKKEKPVLIYSLKMYECKDLDI